MTVQTRIKGERDEMGREVERAREEKRTGEDDCGIENGS